MAMYDANDADAVLAANLGITTYPVVPGTHLRLGTGSAPTATSDMTELTGSGYTAGGAPVSWNAPSGQSTSNSGAVSWTNGSGSSWAIANLEVWDTAGTPLRHYFGQWTSQPISVANGNTFTASAGAVSAQLI